MTLTTRLATKQHARGASKARLFITSALSVVPAFWLMSASAADQSAAEVEEVVVTGSRLVVDGAKAPTPVTVISSEQLLQTSPRTITEALLKLPVLQASASVATQGTGTTGGNGAAVLNLRNIGGTRTLVLLDNRRVVSATATGGVDVALIPEALIQRVDIVTGGASAAYGSDAVAGVVNYILDTKFEGVKVDVSAGETAYKDNQTWKFTVAGGHSFIDGKLHVVGSAEYYKARGVEMFNRRPWAVSGYLGSIVNPAVTTANPASPTNPRQIVKPLNSPANASLGGLVTGATGGSAAGNASLIGLTFDPGSVARPFLFGDFRTATTQSNSRDPNAYNTGLLLVLQPPQERKNAFTHATYAVTDDLDVYGEVLYSENDLVYNSFPTFELSQTAYTIFSDNAFLPASVRNQMVANGTTSITVGRTSPDIAIPRLVADSTTKRAVLGLDGKLSGDWTYKAYYEYGQNHSIFQTTDDPWSERLYQAADAVRNTSGAIVCRTTLTNPNDGCVPMNIFGLNSPSAASLTWATSTAIQDITVKQHVAEGSVQGSVFDLPGGPLGVAAGLGIRKERYDQFTDPLSSSTRDGITDLEKTPIRGYPTSLVNTLGGFERTNPQPAAGGYVVKEVFGEVNAPVLADQAFARSLTLNGAIRYTDYSTSGGVVTWKAGAVWETTDWLRFRGTRSRDIRAPNLGELYRGSSQGTATITDKKYPNNPPRNALTGAIGNTNIDPEIADAWVAGTVVQPITGLTLSADYYSIDIKKAISSLSAQQTVDFCVGGATALCPFIQRDAVTDLISRVQLPFFNVDERLTSGIDFEASYRFDLGPANVQLRVVGTRLLTLKTALSGAAPTDDAGSLGNPHWNGIMTANVEIDRFGVNITERYYGSGIINKNLTPTDIDVNYHGVELYTDVTLNYDFGNEDHVVRGFFTINNLMDKDVPRLPGGLTAGAGVSYSTGPYDKLGRSFTTGVRMKF